MFIFGCLIELYGYNFNSLQYHRAITQYWGELARRLADFAILPMRVTDYSEALKKNAHAFLHNYGDLLRSRELEQGIGILYF